MGARTHDLSITSQMCNPSLYVVSALVTCAYSSSLKSLNITINSLIYSLVIIKQ